MLRSPPAPPMPALTLRPGALTLADLRRLWSTPSLLSLDAAARPALLVELQRALVLSHSAGTVALL